jgi:hypothetical protein
MCVWKRVFENACLELTVMASRDATRQPIFSLRFRSKGRAPHKKQMHHWRRFHLAEKREKRLHFPDKEKRSLWEEMRWRTSADAAL